MSSHEVANLKLKLCFYICNLLTQYDVYPHMINRCTCNVLYIYLIGDPYILSIFDLSRTSLLKNRTILTLYTTILIGCLFLCIVTLGIERLTARPSHEVVNLKLKFYFYVCNLLTHFDVYPHMINMCTCNVL